MSSTTLRTEWSTVGLNLPLFPPFPLLLLCCLAGRCTGVCICMLSTSPHSNGRGGDNSKHEQCRYPLPSPPPPPPPLFLPLTTSLILMLLFLHCHGHQDPSSLSCHHSAWLCNAQSPLPETNWCWRPTITVLSLVVGADPRCHSDCLALWLPLPLYGRLFHGILQLFFFFWNITCQTRLIREPDCFYLPQRSSLLPSARSTGAIMLRLAVVGVGTSPMG